MPGNRSDVETFRYIKAGSDSVSPEFIAIVIATAIWPGMIKNVLIGLYNKPSFSRNTPFWLKVIFDFCVTILPAELLVTVWHTKAFQIFIITSACAAVLIFRKLRQGRWESTENVLFLETKVEFPSRVSYSRSYINILTAISILAVDFPLFPVYFKKSRIYGTSLMDTGLGFYICSNAIVSPEARGVINTSSFRSILKKATIDTLPLIVLGILRYSVMSYIGYHFTSNEYGKHWNFFFTLATVKFGSTILISLTDSRVRKCLGPVIICVHQCILLIPSFRDFMFRGIHGDMSRDNLLDANREGIVSSIGYLAIYFICVEIGAVFMRRRETVSDVVVLLCLMVVLCCSSWLMLELTSYIEIPSRKFANLSYLCFIIGLYTLALILNVLGNILEAFVQHRCGHSNQLSNILKKETTDDSSDVLEAINYNGLVFFVIANIFTGLINLSIDTSTKTDTVAFIILTLYMFTLSVIFVLLYKHKIRLKPLIVKLFKR